MTANPDLVLRNALIYDGSGREPEAADIAVTDERITAIASLPPGRAGEEVDATGLAVAPGFIDTHTHDDLAIIETAMSPKTSQGVTTVVAGNCGISLAPMQPQRDPPPPFTLFGGRDIFRYPRFADYLAAVEKAGTAVNTACLVGHSTLRFGAMDDLSRAATAAETDAMKAALAQALEEGAIGLSSGLEYPPAEHSEPGELEALAAVAGASGGIYTTHMRNEGDRVIEAMQEAFAASREGKVPVVISHHKCSGIANFGRSVETLALFEKALATTDAGLDAYPYDACSTILSPDWAKRARRILVAMSRPHPEMTGRDLDDVAREWAVSRDDAIERLQPAGAIYFDMDEADVRRILAYPHTMIGSDGLQGQEHPHPRLWGTFARVLGHYARDVGLFSMAEAIHRMTGMPAARFGLKHRGRLQVGHFADLVLFDPAAIRDTATFEAPKQAAAGIHTVWVNGQKVWHEGRSTANRPGHVLRRAA